MNITEVEKKYIDNIRGLSTLYNDVKVAFTLAENLDKDHSTYLHPINELRNAFDHLMRCFQYPDRMDHEFNEAKEHMYRAAYDVYEILAIDFSSKIKKDLEKYDSAIISRIFPKYYQEHRPIIISIQEELASLRASKKIDPEINNKRFDNYVELIEKLIKISNEVSKLIPDLEKEKRKDKLNRFTTGIIGGLIGLGLKLVYDLIKT